MEQITIEIDGAESADVDVAAAELIERLKTAQVNITPGEIGGARDGGVLLLTIAILGGASSVAQIAATIHTLTQKKTVQVVVVAQDGRRLTVPQVEAPAEMTKLIEGAIEKK